MIKLKKKEEIEIMREGGRRLREIVRLLSTKIKAGVTTNEIDYEAEKLIRKFNGESSFKKVPGYFWSTCLSVNEQIVHTPPSKRILQEGDLLTLDIGLEYRGYNTDYAYTYFVGKSIDPEKSRFLAIGKRALQMAIRQAKAGNRIGNISQAIEKEIYGNGFFVLKELTGHGIGRLLHEEPYVPGFLDRPLNQTPIIKPGLTIAIEVIYSEGAESFVYERGNEWSVVTADGSLAACFEHTVAVTEKETLVLT